MKAPRFSCRYVLLMFNVHRGRVYAVRLLTVTSSQPDAQRRQPGGERASCCMRENFRVDCRATCWLFSQLAPSVLEHRAGKEALCGLERALFFCPPTPFFFFNQGGKPKTKTNIRTTVAGSTFLPPNIQQNWNNFLQILHILPKDIKMPKTRIESLTQHITGRRGVGGGEGHH